MLRLPVVSMTGAPCSCLKHAGVQDTMQRLVSLCAMLHDVDDWKYCSLPAGTAQKRSIAFLQSQGADKGVIDTVAFVLDRIGFKESLRSTDDGSQDVTHHNSRNETVQTVLHVVQDADRLDALGALSQELPAETMLNPLAISIVGCKGIIACSCHHKLACTFLEHSEFASHHPGRSVRSKVSMMGCSSDLKPCFSRFVLLMHMHAMQVPWA